MLALGFNLGASASWFSQRGDLIRASGQPFLYSLTETYRSAGATDVLSVAMPRRALQALVPDPESLLSVPLDGSLPAMRHLRRYLCMMNEPGSISDDQPLIDHVETTILDLAALALGAQRDVAELASMRGLRAARHAEIVRVIGKGFCNPAFSVQRVAIATGLSPSYIQKILHETGQSFTERVLALRLGKARRMLVNRSNDSLRIGEIALACGFNDISYFNRSFRRRFGAAPNECRGNAL
ncbi:AraC family transcriptional regulator [Bradyrhizobium liaoningense]|uniref:AraC family transcriptional regulator n=1 Tax=Bradyrhizobium liaoningense TaxID=43992 RepID=UPI001BA44E6A|nr:AraC family transcriptional regulator [Bradyrhizobium liaoningense]MBR0715178.1 helix-turn-helix transcriptional regulator [Bradyrhizobium liaoningense]